MSRYTRLAACLPALLFGVALGLSRPAAAQQYTLTPLPSNFGNLRAFNNDGQILGYVGNSPYLFTNGVLQPLPTGSYFFNNKGVVGGIDSSGNLFLYANGITQTIFTQKYSLVVVGLSDSGELVWNAADSATSPNQVYVHQNGVTKNLGPHTATAFNNAGQIVGGSELYSNGAWKTLPNFPGGADGISDNGKISYDIEQTYSGMYGYQTSVNAGIYNIATATASTVVSGTGNQYVPAPGMSRVNREGDVIGGESASTGTSSVQHIGFGISRGQQVSFGHFVSNYPTSHYLYPGVAAQLNNNGDILGSDDSYYNPPDEFYSADTGQKISVSNLITGSDSVSYTAQWFNDRREFIVQTGYPSYNSYLATPNGSVSGNVTLDSIAPNAPAQTITFEFRNALDTSLFTVTANVGPDGAYTLPNIATGIYRIRVKGDKYLAQVITVNSRGSAVTGANVTLPGGDANNDNSVDATDFGVLVGAYNSRVSVPGSGYDPNADFNGDGFLDATDFGILVGNYGAVGAS